MKKLTIECTTELELSFDPESAEFKQSLQDYQTMFNEHGEVNDMLEHVAHNMLRFGYDSMIEGVGYLAMEGKPIPPKAFSGITLIGTDYEPTFDYYIND